MIICPHCKEEIDDDSHYCDQCGHALMFCNKCGRVGFGRRCTFCGGLMVSPEAQSQSIAQTSFVPMSISETSVSYAEQQRAQGTQNGKPGRSMPNGIPMLTLYNTNLNIRIQAVNGAIIGRKQGPYAQFFHENFYVSGVHAQLKYNAASGWCIIDKHSSNGTKLNQYPMQPDVEMSLKDGDIVGIANINLQVSIIK